MESWQSLVVQWHPMRKGHSITVVESSPGTSGLLRRILAVGLVFLWLGVGCGESSVPTAAPDATDLSAPPLDVPVTPDTPADVPEASDGASDDAMSGDGSTEDATVSVDLDVKPPAPAYPKDDTLRINQLQCKGSHNSYHTTNGQGSLVPDWNFDMPSLTDQLELHGVRQVELDVHYVGDGAFEVFHVPVLDEGTTCKSFTDCLQETKDWSDSRPGHHLLFILVEPKDDLDLQKIGGHYDELDAAILSVWPIERVLRPDDVRQGYETLQEALETDGWPTLGATRQKAMFIMLDSGGHREAYLEGHPNLEGRVIFMRDGKGSPTGAILENNDPINSADTINNGALEGYLVRSDADDAKSSDEKNQDKAAAALGTAAHFISSDFPADPANGDYWFDIPDGSPSRCNPVTAPTDCTTADIE